MTAHEILIKKFHIQNHIMLDYYFIVEIIKLKSLNNSELYIHTYALLHFIYVR